MIRSHAQKYFLKVLKNGKSEHVPPPRPKRKANHPYPHKAPKNAISLATGVLQSSAAVLDSVCGSYQYVQIQLAVYICLHGWKQSICQGMILEQLVKKCSSSNHATLCKETGVMPDFAQVYGFVGSIFDNSGSDHLQRLKMMDPIDFQTVLTLMKNLSVNLVSPEFEDHRRLLSSYQVKH